MGIKEDYQKAVALAKKGYLESARVLLVQHDHPKTNALLDKINAAIAEKNATQEREAVTKKQKKKPETLKDKQNPQSLGCLALVVFSVICGFGLFFFSDTDDAGATFDDGTLEGSVRAAFADTFGSNRVEEIQTLVVNDIVVTLRFPLSDFNAWAARTEAENQFPILVCNLRERGLNNRTYQLTGTISVIDALGNGGTAEGVETIIPPDVVNSINCESAENYLVNLAAVAERYDVNPLIQGE